MKTILLVLVILTVIFTLIIFTGNHLSNRPKDKYVDFKPLADFEKLCANPHKGLYHHFFDNGISGYKGLAQDIEALPGCDILFIRMAWSYLEPLEDQYNWNYIDSLVTLFEPKGYRFGFAFTCKETEITFATPKWVKDAGAKGKFVNCWDKQVWEPDYGDPVFMEKLARFHKVVADRYMDKSWLSFVQIASYGTWGEGHNWPASDINYPTEVVKQHILLYTNTYNNPRVRICSSDDVYANSTDKQEIKDFIESKGIFWSDHSIMVAFYLENFAATHSVRSPELFNDTWKSRPVQIELEHYHMVRDAGNWSVPNGTAKGAAILNEALKSTHCTWFGFHGDAKRWLSENPIYATQVSNRVGYWYTINGISLPENIMIGDTGTIRIDWENKGYAPAYNSYQLEFKLVRESGIETIIPVNSNNEAWLPGVPVSEGYQIRIPEGLKPGSYSLKLRLFDQIDTKRIINLALTDSIKDDQGFLSDW
jgi:hypothetical protein